MRRREPVSVPDRRASAARAGDRGLGDALAESEWEQDLYSAGLPGGTQAEFTSVEEAKRRFEELDGRSGRGALLTPGPTEMRALAEAGLLTDRRVNLGGLHAAEGRVRVQTYIHLTPGEAADLRAISEHSLGVTARDLPTGREPVPCAGLLQDLIDVLE